ncbi:uncharacterized protein PG986_011596 [Apiospora aurea]|uniref:Uncharacterized protein n=1 Tax=Apiospora aurea TaxID=335848 RepID=A0ABR1PXK9_9PEZI
MTMTYFLLGKQIAKPVGKRRRIVVAGRQEVSEQVGNRLSWRSNSLTTTPRNYRIPLPTSPGLGSVEPVGFSTTNKTVYTELSSVQQQHIAWVSGSGSSDEEPEVRRI